MLLQLVHWLNESSISGFVRQSEFVFPVAEAAHLFGLFFSVGLVIWIDLRLLGFFMRDQEISETLSSLEPWAKVGFGIMLLSGAVLFVCRPDAYYSTLVFRAKLFLLLLSCLNALYFRRTVIVSGQGSTSRAPWRIRLAGLLSLIFWVAIIILGRWTSYVTDELLRPRL
jgi:hypothetical protein